MWVFLIPLIVTQRIAVAKSEVVFVFGSQSKARIELYIYTSINTVIREISIDILDPPW